MRLFATRARYHTLDVRRPTRTTWVQASLLVLAVSLTACTGGSQKAGSVAGSPSAGGSGTSTAPAGSSPAPGATAAATPAATSGTSATKPDAHPTTTSGANAGSTPGSSPRPGSTSGSATVAPDSSTGTGVDTGSDPSVTIGGITRVPGSPTPAATCDPTVPPVQQVGIIGVQMARVDAAGTAQATTSFSSASDKKIIAVVSLNDHVAVTGTVLTFVRIQGCTYTPSQTYTLKRPLTHFYVEFDATTKPFAPGHYRLRFYLNNKAGWDIAYDIH